MKLIRISVIILSLFICTTALAAPMGNPADNKLPYGDGVLKMKNTTGSIKISFDAESIIDRDLEGASDVTAAETEGEWYLARISYPMFNDRVEPYVKFGAAHLETRWNQHDAVVIVKGDNEIAYGGGLRILLYEAPQYNNLKLTLDGQYRYCNPDIDDVTVTDPSRTVTAAEFKIHEWQAGAIISMEFAISNKVRRHVKKSDIYSIIPYVGLAYSDCKLDSSFTFDEADYDIGDAEFDDNIVLVTGCDLSCPNNVSLNAEGRLIGETSVSGGATVKF